MSTSSTSSTGSAVRSAELRPCDNHEAHYQKFLSAVRSKFTTLLNVPSNTTLFTVNTDGLYEAYLAALPGSQRQHHTCNTCKAFFKNYGGLVYLDSDLKIRSLLWDGNACSGIYRPVASAMRSFVETRAIEGVFVSKEVNLGVSRTGFWNHFAVELPRNRLFRERLLTPGQYSAAKLEDYKNLSRAVDEFKLETLLKINSMMVSSTLTRPELIVNTLNTFVEMKKDISLLTASRRINYLWKKVGELPSATCAPRSSVLGGLVDDLQSGMKDEEAVRRYNEKVDPLYYRRATQIKSGNVASAQKAFEKLGAYPALERRYATVDDVRFLWRNTHQDRVVSAKPSTASGSSPFSGMAAKPKKVTLVNKALSPNPMKVTFARFSKEILPYAVSMYFVARRRRELFQSLTTAVNPGAIPLFRWDMEDNRNPVSWYQWIGGTTPEQYNLSSTGVHKITGICLKPSLWSGDEKSGFGALFLIEGAKDTRYKSAGIGLFPDLLKGEFMPYRSTIDMYSRDKVLAGYDQQMSGILVGDKVEDKDPPIFRVYTVAGYQDYQITSWY